MGRGSEHRQAAVRWPVAGRRRRRVRPGRCAGVSESVAGWFGGRKRVAGFPAKRNHGGRGAVVGAGSIRYFKRL
ncbi:MAG TPA: hypothetical protein PLQ49_10120 [Methanothrix sp.]|nr:hypothetical protein [Methanothrix sp.]